MPDTVQTFSTLYGTLAIDAIADAKMAAVFARGDYHQKDTVDLLSAFVTPRSIFVDGGAHIGSIAIPLAHRVARTVAYEADEKTCAILRHNVAQNGLSIDVRQQGIGAVAGRGEIRSVSEGNAGAHTLMVGEGNVDIVSLDGDMETFDVLKLDVEGMELSVLQGARRIIEHAHPTVLFEVNLSQLRAHGTSLHELSRFFRTREYRLFLPFRLQGMLVLGSMPNISMIAALMYPGAYFLRSTSSVFDVLALAHEKSPVPIVPLWRTMWHVLSENLRDKVRRTQKIFA